MIETSFYFSLLSRLYTSTSTTENCARKEKLNVIEFNFKLKEIE